MVKHNVGEAMLADLFEDDGLEGDSDYNPYVSAARGVLERDRLFGDLSVTSVNLTVMCDQATGQDGDETNNDSTIGCQPSVQYRAFCGFDTRKSRCGHSAEFAVFTINNCPSTIAASFSPSDTRRDAGLGSVGPIIDER